MNLERTPIEAAGPPFPIYQDPVASLLAAHAAPAGAGPVRDATAAHILGVLAAYAYADTRTVSQMMARLGFAGGACVAFQQTVDAMFVFSTAFLIQSRCGRVGILGYRGTELTNLANWLGDADVGPAAMPLRGASLRVHAGFRRNLRATRHAVLAELQCALDGRSLLDPERVTEHPLEALYVTGHSLGGAMAALFALSLAASDEQPALAGKLRAIYTFGQPLVLAEPLPEVLRPCAHRLFRHVLHRDPIPALPAAAWGRLEHFGHEYCFADAAWQLCPRPIAQLERTPLISSSWLAFFASPRRRRAARYSLPEHAPHHYLAALRPAGRVTELGDHDSG